MLGRSRLLYSSTHGTSLMTMFCLARFSARFLKLSTFSSIFSQWEKMEENVESFKNLAENLAKQNIVINDVRCVLEYNKRDLPNIAPVNYLEYALNNGKKRLQSFEVISSTGQNVFAALNAVSQILLHRSEE